MARAFKSVRALTFAQIKAECAAMACPTPFKSDSSDLLATRICDLVSPTRPAWMEAQIAALYADLERMGFRYFQPRVYWGDEWFSPQGLPVIAAPFYLADTRLMRVEEMTTQAPAEGGTPARCRMLLRHEAGHCFDHAYRIAESRGFRRVFGDPSSPYDPDAFVPDRTSQSFVRHLPGFYAQSHPDEDFAETFAVVITPTRARREWARGNSAVRRKLGFVEDLISKRAGKRPLVADDGSCDYAAQRMRSTLQRYYERRLQNEARAARRRELLRSL